MPLTMEEIINDERYMWVALGGGENKVPEFVYETAEQAVEVLLDTDYLLRPVPVYELIGADKNADKQQPDLKHMWIIVDMDSERPMILFYNAKNAASYIMDDKKYCMKPLKICKTLKEEINENNHQ